MAKLLEAEEILISAATLAETLIVVERKGVPRVEVEALLRRFEIDVVDVDAIQARVAADARKRFPINFGDCFVYALAKVRNDEILTMDAEFAKTDARLVT